MRWESSHLTFAFLLVILTALAVLPHTITNALADHSSDQQSSDDSIFKWIHSLFTLAFQHHSGQTLLSNYLTKEQGQGQDDNHGKLSFSGFSDSTEEQHESQEAQEHENEDNEHNRLLFSGFSDSTEEHHESAKAQVHEHEHGENTKNHHSNEHVKNKNHHSNEHVKNKNHHSNEHVKNKNHHSNEHVKKG